MHKRNIMLQLSYDGYSYLGWQRLGDQQKNKSIQGIVETQLSSLLGEDVRIVGSGRTDAGVHAFAQVANFYTESKLACDVIKKQLNKGLPDDIKVHTVNEVLMNFHSRFSAKGKVYRYYIDNEIRESVFARQYSYHIEEKLNLDEIGRAHV